MKWVLVLVFGLCGMACSFPTENICSDPETVLHEPTLDPALQFPPLPTDPNAPCDLGVVNNTSEHWDFTHLGVVDGQNWFYVEMEAPVPFGSSASITVTGQVDATHVLTLIAMSTSGVRFFGPAQCGQIVVFGLDDGRLVGP